MPYNILQIRTEEAETDPFYPVILNKGNSVRMLPADGPNVEKFGAGLVSVGEAPKNGPRKELGSFGDHAAVHTVLLTDLRLIILSPNFKKGDTGLALWGMPNLYLASTALAKLKTHNKALVGHVPLCSIDRVAVLGTGSKQHNNAVRVYLSEITDSGRRRLYLHILLRIGTDPRLIAKDIIRRIAKRWLSYASSDPKLLSENGRATLTPLADGALLQSSDKEWVGQNFPASWTISQKMLERIGMA